MKDLDSNKFEPIRTKKRHHRKPRDFSDKLPLCGHKHSYKNRAHVEWMRFTLKKQHWTKKNLRFYRCPRCRYWHLTSKPKYEPR